MRKYLLFLFLFFIAHHALSQPTQPMRKLSQQPLPDFSSCHVSSSVCMDVDEFSQPESVLFSQYCMWSDEFGQKITASTSCQNPTPKQFKCSECTCPAGFFREPDAHVCVPQKLCIYGIRDLNTGDCYPDWCPYGDCPSENALDQCRAGENAILIPTADPFQDQCVCPESHNWDPNMSTCVSCPAGHKWVPQSFRCERDTCDIKDDLRLPPDQSEAAAIAACMQRDGVGFTGSIFYRPIYKHGYCWTALQILNRFCGSIWSSTCDISPLFDQPEISDNQRRQECNEEPPKRSSSRASVPLSSLPQASVSNSSLRSQNSSQNASQNFSANGSAFASSQASVNSGNASSSGVGNTSSPNASAPSGNNNNNQSSSKGECDPTAKNYLTCLGGSSNFPAHTPTESGLTSFADVNKAFYGRVSNSDVVKSFTNVRNIIQLDDAQCPKFEIDLTETLIAKPISTTIHCDLMATISPYIKIIMIIVWSFLAFRIFASA